MPVPYVIKQKENLVPSSSDEYSFANIIRINGFNCKYLVPINRTPPVTYLYAEHKKYLDISLNYVYVSSDVVSDNVIEIKGKHANK